MVSFYPGTLLYLFLLNCTVLAQNKCLLMSCFRTSVHLSPSSIGTQGPPYACRGENVTFICEVINGLTLQWASEPNIPCELPMTYTAGDDAGEIRAVGSYRSHLISVARAPPYSNFSSDLTVIPPQFVNSVTVQCGDQLSACSNTEAESTVNITDAPIITHDMLRWTVFEKIPNVSIVIEFKMPEDNIVTELRYNLSVFSSSGLELQVLERTLNTTLSCNTQYWVTGTVSNDCGSNNVTVTIPPQVCPVASAVSPSGNNTSNISASCSTSVAIAAVVSCAVSFITGALVSAVVQNSKCKKFYSLRKAQKQQKPQPAPVYEEIDVENVVYGPMQQ